MKKSRYLIILFFITLIFPLTLESVSCEWIYLEDLAKSNNSNLGLNLGKFDYLDGQYPNDETGQNNKDTSDTIIGNNPNNNNIESLNDPNSIINTIGLNSTILGMKGRDYVVSDDRTLYNGKPTTYRDIMGVPANMNFLIHRLTKDDLDVQNYVMYTTDVNMKEMKTSSSMITYVYPIFKTEMTWTRIKGSEGKWTYGQAKIGYAPLTKIETQGIIIIGQKTKINFFDHNKFVEGYLGLTLNNTYTVKKGDTITAYNNGSEVFFTIELPKKGSATITALNADKNALITVITKSGTTTNNNVTGNSNNSQNVTLRNSSNSSVKIYFKVTGNNTKITIK